MSSAIAAAGGIVWRVEHGLLELAIIHRPRYDDWTLPKGKLDPGESELACAVREVREETGAVVAVSRRVTTVRYDIGNVRKNVTYWAMRRVSGDFVANDEVDDVAWLALEDTHKRLTYGIDRVVLAEFTAMPLPDSVIVLVRHAKAGKRGQWRGDDDLRPLEPVGRVQAESLAQSLAYFAPDSVYAADRTRCIETVEPLAAALGVQVQVEPAFADERYLESPAVTQTALLSLAKPGRVSVVCSQGTTIPALIDRLGSGARSSDTRKGAAWVLSAVYGDIIAADHYDAP